MKEMRTKRLTIRPFTNGDGEDLYDYLSDELVVKYETYGPFSKQQALVEAIKRTNDQSFYAVCLLSGKLIGNVYLVPKKDDTWELGFALNRQYWGQGYAMESVLKVLHYAFDELQAKRIIAICNVENQASWKLMERMKMRREGNNHKHIYFNVDRYGNPIWQDIYQYIILKEEWNK